MIPCEVFPSRTASSAQLQALGAALQAFFALPAPLAGATFGDRETEAVDDLLDGELPSPVAIRGRMVGRIRNAAIIPDDEELSDVERASYIGEVVNKARTVAFVINYQNDDWLAQIRARLDTLRFTIGK